MILYSICVQIGQKKSIFIIRGFQYTPITIYYIEKSAAVPLECLLVASSAPATYIICSSVIAGSLYIFYEHIIFIVL